MIESQVSVVDTPNLDVYGEYLVRVVRIPTNPENPKDEEFIIGSGFKATRKYFETVLGNIEIESLDALVSFHIGGNYADLRGTFKIKKKKGNSKCQ